MHKSSVFVVGKAVWKLNAPTSIVSTILQACADKKFCLQLTDGKLELKRTDKYYKQVQTQIFVTGSQYCYFVVWMTKDCVIVRVIPDVDLWETTLLPVSQKFFHKVVLPELVTCHFTKDPSTPQSSADLQPNPTQKPKRRARQEKTAETAQPHCSQGTHKQKKQAREKTEVWCTCRQREDLDDMVACDNQNCAIQWFHLGSVGLSSAPTQEEPWLCDMCSQA